MEELSKARNMLMPLNNFDLTSNTFPHPVTCAFGRQPWRLPAASEFCDLLGLVWCLRNTHISWLWLHPSQSEMLFSSGRSSQYTTLLIFECFEGKKCVFSPVESSNLHNNSQKVQQQWPTFNGIIMHLL